MRMGIYHFAARRAVISPDRRFYRPTRARCASSLHNPTWTSEFPQNTMASLLMSLPPAHEFAYTERLIHIHNFTSLVCSSTPLVLQWHNGIYFNSHTSTLDSLQRFSVRLLSASCLVTCCKEAMLDTNHPQKSGFNIFTRDAILDLAPIRLLFRPLLAVFPIWSRPFTSIR